MPGKWVLWSSMSPPPPPLLASMFVPSSCLTGTRKAAIIVLCHSGELRLDGSWAWPGFIIAEIAACPGAVQFLWVGCWVVPVWEVGVSLMAFFALSVVFSHPTARSHVLVLSVPLHPQSGLLLRTLGCPRCCAVLGRPSAQLGKEVCPAAPPSFMTPLRLWLAEVLHFQAWSFSSSCAWGNTLLFTRRLQNCGDRSVYTTDSTRPAGGC